MQLFWFEKVSILRMQCWGCCYSKIKIIGFKLSLWFFLVSDNIVKNVNPAKKSVNNCPTNWFPSGVANNHCKTRTKWDSRFYSFFYDCCFLIFHYFQSPFFSIYDKYKNQLMNNQGGFFVCLWVVLFVLFKIHEFLILALFLMEVLCIQR